MSTISAGTTTATALALSGDTTGALTFQVNGTTTAATISSSGNVSLATGNLTFSSTGQRITGDMSNATVSNRLLFQNSVTNGNTVIGAIPNGTSTTSQINLESDSAVANGAIAQFIMNGTTDVRIASSIRGSGTYVPMAFFTGGSERMRLDTSGNLGIGASIFSGRLNVTGSSSALLADQTSAYAPSANSNSTSVILLNESQTTGAYTSLEFWARNAANNINIAYIASPSTSTNNSGTLVFGRRTGSGTSAESMRIDSSGNVGIGTSSPTDKLHVAGGSGSTIRNTASAGSSWFVGSNVDSYILHNESNTPMLMTTNGTERMRITAGGEVYIAGTTDQGAYNLQCNGTGVWGAGAYVNGSDARLKDNIQSLDSGLDVIKVMRPVTFQYKPEYSKDQSVQPGFIAQELQEAMAGKPYLEGVVQEGTNHLNVAYQGIIPILVKAMQEQQDQIKALQDKIAALEAQ